MLKPHPKPLTPAELAAQDEIRAVIVFYTGRGWDWLTVVAFLSAKAIDTWPPAKR